MKDYIWLKSEIVAEIKFTEWTTGSVIDLRDDKAPQEVSREAWSALPRLKQQRPTNQIVGLMSRFFKPPDTIQLVLSWRRVTRGIYRFDCLSVICAATLGRIATRILEHD